ncbi:hypothetical protein AAE478_001097 [Parahypoxylon ruwenzoriense]
MQHDLANHFFQPPPSAITWPPSPRHHSFQRGSAAPLPPPPPLPSSFSSRAQLHDEQHQHQYPHSRLAADQEYKAMLYPTLTKAQSASHERAVFQDEMRARARRRDAARNRALFRGPIYKRPEFFAILLGVLGLVYPVVNQYVIQPWYQRGGGDGAGHSEGLVV